MAGGGIIQLVAYGAEDLYLTHEPQITYFKVTYRRHTNFSTETIPIYFSQDNPDFGERMSCTLSPEGDLINKAYIVVKLPKISSVSGSGEGVVDSNGVSVSGHNKFAWVRRLGYVLLKKVEIEINGRVIDRHYGEWLNIWNELVGPRTRGNDKNIGHIPELYDFTETKDEYTLVIPLQFWFCRNSGLALPMVALKYSEVKINVEFNDLENCYVTTPTHYIECNNDLVNFKKYEYIEQKIDGVKRAGLFVNYDIINKRLYYLKFTKEKFKGIDYDGDASTLTDLETQTIIESDSSVKYQIVGAESDFIATPNISVKSKSNYMPSLSYISIRESFLLVDYVFLDSEERQKMAKAKHDYLIEQLYFTPNVPIESINPKIKIHADQPAKMMAWVVQSDNVYNSNDTFNYTCSHRRERKESKLGHVTLGNTTGDSIVKEETVLLNGKERVSFRSQEYFTWCQPNQHFNYSPSKGTNIYSFGFFPEAIQPSGSCSFGQIESIEVKLKLIPSIGINGSGVFRCYVLAQNILRVSSGLAALLFNR